MTPIQVKLVRDPKFASYYWILFREGELARPIAVLDDNEMAQLIDSIEKQTK